MAALASTRCAFCPVELPEEAEEIIASGFLGPLLGPLTDDQGDELWVHRMCAVWTPEVRTRLQLYELCLTNYTNRANPARVVRPTFSTGCAIYVPFSCAHLARYLIYS
jgi:hypothetical protein